MNVFQKIPMQATGFSIVMTVSCFVEEAKRQELEAALRNLLTKWCEMRFTPYGFWVGFNGLTAGSIRKTVPETADRIFEILAALGIPGEGVCPLCGREMSAESSRIGKIEGVSVTMDAECIQQINTEVEKQNETFRQMPNNYEKVFSGRCSAG